MPNTRQKKPRSVNLTGLWLFVLLLVISFAIRQSEVIRIKPVSYTHLDVYKRQTVGKPCYDFYVRNPPSIEPLLSLRMFIAR